MSFILLALENRPVNAQLERVAWIDAAVLLVLAASAGLMARTPVAHSPARA